jgi:hypothetical protein
LLIAVAIASVPNDILTATLTAAMDVGFGNHGLARQDNNVLFCKFTQNHVFLHHHQTKDYKPKTKNPTNLPQNFADKA